jgi:hypothetical protein
MPIEQSCGSCSNASGCTARHTEESRQEEVGAAPFLIVAGVIIVVLSIVLQRLF